MMVRAINQSAAGITQHAEKSAPPRDLRDVMASDAANTDRARAELQRTGLFYWAAPRNRLFLLMRA